MLLKEMFSPIGAPNEAEQDIDWLGDLKFFIDNDTDVLSKQFFPAIRKHKEHQGHPKAYQLYITPLESVCETYCKKFQVEGRDEKFSKDKLIELAKNIAEQQEQFMKKGDYSKKK
jgi:hypothetical protein